jgi:2-isopropylmalate synthase
VNAVTDGIDAQAIVTVRLKNNKKITSANGSSTSVLTASAIAYINCLEKLH